jgi:YD repeat-containing protein
LGLWLLALGVPAPAGVITFTDRLAWLAQITSLSNFDSGTQAAGTATNFGLGGLFYGNLQVDGYNIINSTGAVGNNITRVNPSASQSYYNWNGAGTILRTDDNTSSTTTFARLTFATPVSAFGFNYGVGGCATFFAGCLPGPAGNFTISIGGLTPINVSTVASNTLSFFGVASDTQTFTVADIYISDVNRYVVLDDIAQGSYSAAAPASEVAEPGTLLQIGIVSMLLALVRWRTTGEEHPAR